MDGFLPVLARKSRFLRRQRARFHPFSLVGLHAGQPEPIPNRIWNYRRVLETDGIAIMQEGARKGFVSPVGVCENACNIAPVLTHDRGMEDCDPAVEQVFLRSNRSFVYHAGAEEEEGTKVFIWLGIKIKVHDCISLFLSA